MNNNLKIINFNKCNKIYLQKVTKFKTIGVKIIYNLPFNYKFINAYSLLGKYLGNCSKKYPGISSLNKAIDNLYGADFDIGTTTSGNMYSIIFSIRFINPKYVNDDTLIEKAISMLHDIIFNPLIEEDGGLNEEIFKICKDNCMLDVESANELNLRYVANKLFTSLAKSKTSSFALKGNYSGFKKVLESLDRFNILKYYNKLIHTPFTVMVSGDIKFNYYESLIRKYFNVKGLRSKKIERMENVQVDEIKPIIVKADVKQAKVVVAYKIPILLDDPLFYAFLIANYILSGSLSSKFYKSIREEKGLCYNINGSYNSNFGFYVVGTGVAPKNVDLVIKEIDNEIKEVQKGNFTNEDIINAKKHETRAVLYSEDTLYRYLGAIQNYNEIGKEFVLEEVLDKINNVTKEDIINASKLFEYKGYAALVSKK